MMCSEASVQTNKRDSNSVCSCLGHPVISAELLFLRADWYHYGSQSGSVDVTHTKHTHQVGAERTAAAPSALRATMATQEEGEKQQAADKNGEGRIREKIGCYRFPAADCLSADEGLL